ncbi:MAG: sigma-E factor negative regulatory protein [Granulosicoccus sp.]|nr:sigma-E factor negative regulatory protein [Granulosicoccus sp.]
MDNSNPPDKKEQLSQLMDGEWRGLNASECVKGVCSDSELRRKWTRYHLIRDVLNNEPVQADTQLVSRICAAIADEPGYSNITPLANYASLDEVHGRVARDDASSSNSEGAAAVHLAPMEGASEANSGQSTAGEAAALRDAVPVSRPDMLRTGMAGFALAASVAAITVVGMNAWHAQSPVTGQAVANNSGADLDVRRIDVDNAFSRQVTGVPLPEVDLVANTGSYWVSPKSSQRVGDEERLNMMLSLHIESSPTADREGLLPYSRLIGYDERGLER